MTVDAHTGMHEEEPRTDPSVDSTTERILTATIQVYAEAGFRGTTTRRIAQQAGVNEITLFRHYGTKEALVKAALSRIHRQTHPVTLGEPVRPERELYDWALSTYRHWYDGRHLISKVLGDLAEHPELAPDICEEPSDSHAMVSRYLDRLRQVGLATGDFNSDAAAGMLLGSVFTHAIWRDHFTTPDLPAPEEVVSQYVLLLLASVGFRQAPARARKEKA
jgi:AcrR family transcriptional regulator